MKKNKKILFILLLLITAVIVLIILQLWKNKSSDQETKQIKPVYEDIQNSISTAGDVQPQNRLEIKPQVNGRLEKVMVKEGDRVRAGQVVAWMSSMARAALIDSARAQGEATMKYWADVYKPIPLVSPIYGEVIVQTIQPGQTITVADPVVVLSDRLIVQAQIDETDIGHIKINMPANITIDAYPDVQVAGKVVRIYYESVVVNNVTIYKVDILPDKVPSFFRSGMSANVDIITLNKKNILTIPADSVVQRNGNGFVLLNDKGLEKRHKIEIGISDDKNVEVLSGLSTNDIILVKNQKSMPKFNKSKGGGNPFMPSRGGRSGGGR